MFHSTRLKLTAWYLLLIIFISLVFSVVIYIDVNRELGRLEHFQTIRQERIKDDFGDLPVPPVSMAVDMQLIKEARARLIANLILLNICIVAGSGVAGYFLAGRTLNPIKKMVDNQARFIGDASHELKTPLTSLRSEIEVFLRSKKITLKEANDILKSNLEDVIRLQSLTDSLMEFASYESAGTNIPFEKLQLTSSIADAIKNITPLAKAKDIQIINKTVKVSIFGNEQSLSRLFTILLDNAIKYSDKKKKVTITNGVSNNIAYVKITDQGVGIKEDDLKNIFNRFYRTDKSRSSNEVSGYGLGLSIASEIVRIHNGSIEAKSSEKGSVFIVEFPV